jgi:hypothetical protein
MHKLSDLEFVFGHAGIEPLLFDLPLVQTIREGPSSAAQAGPGPARSTTRHSYRRSSLQQLRQLGDIGSDPPRLVFSQALVHGPVRLIVEIDIGELLPAPVGDDEALIVGLDRPGRGEAARIHAI